MNLFLMKPKVSALESWKAPEILIDLHQSFAENIPLDHFTCLFLIVL